MLKFIKHSRIVLKNQKILYIQCSHINYPHRHQSNFVLSYINPLPPRFIHYSSLYLNLFLIRIPVYPNTQKTTCPRVSTKPKEAQIPNRHEISSL